MMITRVCMAVFDDKLWINGEFLEMACQRCGRERRSTQITYLTYSLGWDGITHLDRDLKHFTLFMWPPKLQNYCTEWGRTISLFRNLCKVCAREHFWKTPSDRDQKI